MSHNNIRDLFGSIYSVETTGRSILCLLVVCVKSHHSRHHPGSGPVTPVRDLFLEWLRSPSSFTIIDSIQNETTQRLTLPTFFVNPQHNFTSKTKSSQPTSDSKTQKLFEGSLRLRRPGSRCKVHRFRIYYRFFLSRSTSSPFPIRILFRVRCVR